MLEDLNNIFDEFNSYETADARLYNSTFDIKKIETFDRFLITFTAIIVSL